MKNTLTILIAMLSMHAAFAQCLQSTGILYSNVTYNSAVINYPGYVSQNWIVEWGYPGFTPGTDYAAGGRYVTGSNYEFGNSLTSGIYIGEFIAGNERKLMRVVKQDEINLRFKFKS